MIPFAGSEFAAQQSPTLAVMLAPRMLCIAHSTMAGGAEAVSSGLDELVMRAAGAHGNAEGGAAAASPGDISGPEERLAFALSDGRVGVLAVKGRKVCRQTSLGSMIHIVCSDSAVKYKSAGQAGLCISDLSLPIMPVHTPSFYHNSFPEKALGLMCTNHPGCHAPAALAPRMT